MNIPQYEEVICDKHTGGGNGNPLQYSCLENPIDRGAWQTPVHGVARIGHDLMSKTTTTKVLRDHEME